MGEVLTALFLALLGIALFLGIGYIIAAGFVLILAIAMTRDD